MTSAPTTNPLTDVPPIKDLNMLQQLVRHIASITEPFRSPTSVYSIWYNRVPPEEVSKTYVGQSKESSYHIHITGLTRQHHILCERLSQDPLVGKHIYRIRMHVKAAMFTTDALDRAGPIRRMYKSSPEDVNNPAKTAFIDTPGKVLKKDAKMFKLRPCLTLDCCIKPNPELMIQMMSMQKRCILNLSDSASYSLGMLETMLQDATDTIPIDNFVKKHESLKRSSLFVQGVSSKTEKGGQPMFLQGGEEEENKNRTSEEKIHEENDCEPAERTRNPKKHKRDGTATSSNGKKKEAPKSLFKKVATFFNIHIGVDMEKENEEQTRRIFKNLQESEANLDSIAKIIREDLESRPTLYTWIRRIFFSEHERDQQLKKQLMDSFPQLNSVMAQIKRNQMRRVIANGDGSGVPTNLDGENVILNSIQQVMSSGQVKYIKLESELIPNTMKKDFINLHRSLLDLQGADSPAHLDLLFFTLDPCNRIDYGIQVKGFDVLSLSDIRRILSLEPRRFNDIWVDFQTESLYIHYIGPLTPEPFEWVSRQLRDIPISYLTRSANVLPVTLEGCRPLVLGGGEEEPLASSASPSFNHTTTEQKQYHSTQEGGVDEDEEYEQNGRNTLIDEDEDIRLEEEEEGEEEEEEEEEMRPTSKKRSKFANTSSSPPAKVAEKKHFYSNTYSSRNTGKLPNGRMSKAQQQKQMIFEASRRMREFMPPEDDDIVIRDLSHS